jgi:invasion protein IalB
MSRGAPSVRLFCIEKLDTIVASLVGAARDDNGGQNPMNNPGQFTAAAVCRALVAATALAVVASPAFAQQPKAPPPPAQKGPPPPAQKGGQPQQQPQGDQGPQLTYSAWTKVCQKGPEANAKRLCFIGKDGKIESGQPIVAAVLIEPEGEPRKILRVTLPLGMALQPGTRVIVDSGQPVTAPYVICLPNGCMADYEASGELIGKMKAGQNLHVQGVNGQGQPISLPLPLGDFAKSYDGPATEAPKQ